MSTELLEQLRSVQQTIDPQFKALRTAVAALKGAIKVTDTEKPEALAMQKALAKLEQAAALVDDAALQEATTSFANDTQTALDALAFEFARDLRATFAEQGISVNGRPPTLTVGDLTLQINTTTRKAQWLYGKEELTRPIPLSITALVKAYQQQTKAIEQRDLDGKFLPELYKAWRNIMDERSRAPSGNRLNLVETYSRYTLNQQAARFWNAPSRSTFKDVPRPLFVRDLVLAQAAPIVESENGRFRLRLGVATKSQAGNASRSIWLPRTALEGDYYGDITFEEVN